MSMYGVLGLLSLSACDPQTPPPVETAVEVCDQTELKSATELVPFYEVIVEYQYDENSNKIYLNGESSNDKAVQAIYDQVIENNKENLLRAFKTKKLDRIIFRKNSHFNAEFIAFGKEESEVLKALGNVIVVKIPENKPENIGIQELSDFLSHEIFHALSADKGLSLTNTVPSSKHAEWIQICTDVRNQALTETKDFREIPEWRALRKAARNTELARGINTVDHTLRTNTFTSHQVSEGEVPSRYKEERHGCEVSDPWEATVRSAADINPSVNPSSSLYVDLAIPVRNQWTNFLAQRTIYSVVTERTYRVGSTLGHPQDSWDELVTSTANTLYLHPEALERNLTALPTDKQATMRTLVQASLDVFKEDVDFN